MEVAFYKSPIGVLKIFSSDIALHKIELVKERNDFECSTFNYRVIDQLEAYFDGRLLTFNIPLALDKCTTFQKRVYDELLKVRYGRTKSYKELAEMVGNPNASRAIGNAMAKNPIPIIIPCHRIINSNGKIGKYSLGFDDSSSIKSFLLDFEKQHS